MTLKIPDCIRDPLHKRAIKIMNSRAPDVVIQRDGPQLQRWVLFKHWTGAGLYLHRFLKDDEDRALHDHPWPSLSVNLFGTAREIYDDGDPYFAFAPGERIIPPGSVIYRPARFAHRVCLAPGTKQVVTLFFIGPKVREWGFWCPKGWRHWKEFVDQRDHGSIGKGCAE